MEISDLRIEMYNKVVDISLLSRPEILSELCILDKMHYHTHVNCFNVVDSNQRRLQLYHAKIPPRPSKILEQIIYLKNCPKILFLNAKQDSLILEQSLQDRLSDFLIYYQKEKSPYLQESNARFIIQDVIESLEDYAQHKINYDCLSPKNIVKVGDRWALTTVAPIFAIEHLNQQYYCQINHKSTELQKVHTFALGSLLFKLLFGFPPFQSENLITYPFAFSTYMDEYLRKCRHQKSLKTYYFMERINSISPQALDLLSSALSLKLSLAQWKQHEYFTTLFSFVPRNIDKNKQFMMLSETSERNLSLALSSIEYRNKYSMEKLNSVPVAGPQDSSYIEVVENYSRHPLLRHLIFSQDFRNQRSKLGVLKMDSQWQPTSIGDYFYEHYFDIQSDYPCKELLKLLDKDREDNPRLYLNDSTQRQQQIKRYAYPYAIAFELCKIQFQQPVQIRRIIPKTIQLLLQVSSLNRVSMIKPLHHVDPQYNSFSEFKTAYRANLHEIYRHMLSEAMRKYNSKNDNLTIAQKIIRKEKGLQYYKLCLKLMEASLIVRKGGKDLNLARIETAGVKEIQHDLEELLRVYFPSKPQVC